MWIPTSKERIRCGFCVSLMLPLLCILANHPAGDAANIVETSAAVPGPQTVANPAAAIKINVTLVTVPVLVTGRDGLPVRGLTERDFRLYENGVEQSISRLIPEVEACNVLLMMDQSGSTHFKSGEMQDAATALIDSLRPQDRMSVVSFAQRFRLDADFTGDRSQLRLAVRQAGEIGGITRLYDAVRQVLDGRLTRLSGRKAVVLFTDGVDSGSIRAGPQDTLSMIDTSDAMVYAVQYDTRDDVVTDRFHVPLPAGYPTFNELYNRGVRYLRDLAGHSGGRVYQAQSVDKLRSAFAQIAEELQNQYTLCYYPANQKRDGSLRRLRVTVARPGVSIHARVSYRAGTSE